MFLASAASEGDKDPSSSKTDWASEVDAVSSFSFLKVRVRDFREKYSEDYLPRFKVALFEIFSSGTLHRDSD